MQYQQHFFKVFVGSTQRATCGHITAAEPWFDTRKGLCAMCGATPTEVEEDRAAYRAAQVTA